MELYHIFQEPIELELLVENIISNKKNLDFLIRMIDKNPDYIEEKCVGTINEQLLIELISLGIKFPESKYLIIAIIDFVDEACITNSVFNKLCNFPCTDTKESFIISLSHKKLSESQLIYLCRIGITFECYFELACLYYTNKQYSIEKLSKFLHDFHEGSYGDMYAELINELYKCYNSSDKLKKEYISYQWYKYCL